MSASSYQSPDTVAPMRGFQLLASIGEGSFARVYLARQHDLANRHVVLKVGADTVGESRTLARLQHPNIVPVYSAFNNPPHGVICMPFLGATTLDRVFRALADTGRVPTSGSELVDCFLACRDGGARSLARTVRPLHTPRPNLPSDRPADGQTARLRRKPGSAPAPPQGAVLEAPPLPDTVEMGIIDLPEPPPPGRLLENLRRLSYADAVLWLVGRLADGLAHAHERGVLHRDVKPSNVLWADDGQPMLLDFNVAADAHGEEESLGGTPEYMAPEHLRLMAGDPPLGEVVDARSDLFSLGVVLHQFLTLLHPGDGATGDRPYTERVATALRRRRESWTSIRLANVAAPPAAEAIVRKCLAIDPAKRYACANDLADDIRRHLADLPLRHAGNLSTVERARKWARRHPRLASWSTATAIGAVLLLGGASYGVHRERDHRLEVARLAALENFREFQTEADEARFLLTVQRPGADELDRGLAVARRALGRFGESDDRGALLPETEREQLGDRIGEVLLLTARGVALQAARQEDAKVRSELLRWAFDFNGRAAALRPEALARAAGLQHAEVVSLSGRTDEANKLRAEWLARPARSARDYFLAGTEHVAQGRLREAVTQLTRATELAPRDFWGWFYLGYAHAGLGNDTRAVTCYTACVPLNPDFPFTYFNRGLVHLRLKDANRAEADFTSALTRKPDHAESHVNRALAREAMGKTAEAEADVTRALDLGEAATRLYFLRSRLRTRLGDRAGAKADWDEGLRRPPTDEKSWVARGRARIASDPVAAMADLEKALEINPHSLSALQNKAHLLSKAGKNEQAAGVLDRVVELYPDFVDGRSGRAVLLARLGKRNTALEDATQSLLLSTAPPTLYQVAGVYALTSRAQPDDRREALRLLASALKAGFGADLLDGDRDLDPIRDTPEFKRLADAAKSLQKDVK